MDIGREYGKDSQYELRGVPSDGFEIIDSVYEKDIEDTELKKAAAKIIDSFYVEEVDETTGEREKLCTNVPQKSEISAFPPELKEEIMRQWLSSHTGECLVYFGLFGKLPDRFQKELAEHLEGFSGYIPGEELFAAFNTITDEKLVKIILANSRSFEKLAQNRRKIPLATDDDLLTLARGPNGTEWDKVIPYIDKFPTVDKNKAVVELLARGQEARGEVLVYNLDKLGMTMEQLIGLCAEYKQIGILIRNIGAIDSKYEQTIVDKCLETEETMPIAAGAVVLSRIDAGAALSKMAKIGVGRKVNNGLRNIAMMIRGISDVWANQMPDAVLKSLVSTYPESMAPVADKYGDRIDRPALVRSLFEIKKYSVLIAANEALDLKLDSNLALEIISRGGAAEVAACLSRFEPLSPRVFHALFEENRFEIFKNLFCFTGLTKADAIDIVSSGILREEDLRLLERMTECFDGLAIDKDYAEALIKGRHFDNLINILDTLVGINKADIAEKMIEAGGVDKVIINLNKFEGVDHKYVANAAIENNRANILLLNFDEFSDLDKNDLLKRLLEAGLYSEVVSYFELFVDLKLDRAVGQQLVENALADPEFDIGSIAYVSESFKPPINRALAVANEMFGEYLTRSMYETVKKIKEGSCSRDDLRTLGIDESGESGIRQLRAGLEKFKKDVLEPDFDARRLIDSPFHRQYYKAIVRFDESEWGYSTDEHFDELITTRVRLDDERAIQPLAEAYAPSGEVRVARIDRDDQELFRYSEQFLNRYGTLRRSLQDAVQILDDNHALSKMVESMATTRESVIANMEAKILLKPKDAKEEVGWERRNRAIREKIDNLKSLELRSVKDFQNNFTVLAQFAEFQGDMRQLVFYYALKKNKNYRDKVEELVGRGVPTFDDVGAMVNFVGHIVNEETWADYFTDRQSVKAFENLVNVRALEEEFARAQNSATKGELPMEFVPTRGLLMEYSGYVADACWASVYKSIAKDFPNFFAVTIVQNRGTKHERLAGASMMIETEAEDGRSLLVIRGLNPQENVINGLSVKDFFEKYVSYAWEQAKKAGRELAIVVDDHCGGSATNRPALFEYLTDVSSTLTPIKLRSKDDTTFNEYNIVDNVYLLTPPKTGL